MDREKRDLLISWLTVSFAFAWIGPVFFFSKIGDFFTRFLIILVAVGTGFILHELAHKYLAIHYGAHAEFRAWNMGLLFALLLAFFTSGQLVFAAPGAVYIFGEHISRKQNGLISLAGPVTNIVLGLVFLGLVPFAPNEFFGDLFQTGASINFWLGLFNLIPIFPLDGAKVLQWNALVWAGFFFPLLYFFFIGF